jgi:hypothetical protein
MYIIYFNRKLRIGGYWYFHGYLNIGRKEKRPYLQGLVI